jgi:hypothetical protein
MKTIRTYKSKQAAIKAMWRYWWQEIGGSPLVGDNGTTLQGCPNNIRTVWVSVSRAGGYYDAVWELQTNNY